MATMSEKVETEIKVRELLKTYDLPQPDSVEYGHTCIRLFYEEPKVCLIIDIDEPPPGFERLRGTLDDVELDDQAAG